MRLAKAMLMAAAIASGTAAVAQSPPPQPRRPLPPGWHYEIRNGRRVPRPDRVTNPDGSWREEIRQGKCVTIKQRSASGKYTETRECDGS